MKKKLTAQGPKDRKSYTVTLPIEWVKEQGVDKRKSVDLEIIGNRIIISNFSESKPQIIINAKAYSNNFIKILQGLYRRGEEEIKLNFKNSKFLEIILPILDQKLIGFEIVEQKKDFIIIKDIAHESNDDFNVIFRRVFFLILELSESEDLIQINSLDKSIKKFINYCQRTLMKQGHSEFRKVPLYYLILDRLEKLTDEFKWFLKIKSSKTINSEDFIKLKLILRIAHDLFYKFDEKKYNEYQYQSYLLKNKIKLNSKVDLESLHLHNIARILNSIYGDIFTLRFNK